MSSLFVYPWLANEARMKKSSKWLRLEFSDSEKCCDIRIWGRSFNIISINFNKCFLHFNFSLSSKWEVSQFHMTFSPKRPLGWGPLAKTDETKYVWHWDSDNFSDQYHPCHQVRNYSFYSTLEWLKTVAGKTLVWPKSSSLLINI